MSRKLNVELPQSLRVIKVSIERKMSTIPRRFPEIEKDRYFEEKIKKVIKANLYEKNGTIFIPEILQKFGIELNKTQKRMARIEEEIIYVIGLFIILSAMLRDEEEKKRKRY